jgi:hypothetical protein
VSVRTSHALLPAALALAALLLITAPAASAAAEPQRLGARPPGEQPAPAAAPGSPSTPVATPQGATAAPSGEPAPAAEPPRRGLYVGVASCATSTCHGSTVPRGAFDVLQNEYYTWLEEDAHSRAYEVLGNERSRAMALNLGLAQPAYETPACLACHSLAPPAAQQARRLEVEDGVSCESCHGPASGWLEGHHTEEWSRQDSLDAGLVDLDRADRRAELCLGCHLGQGERRVDHELLAAGHPQLVFELDNFTADLPPHWPPASRLADRRRGERLAEQRGAGAWAVGQAATFRGGMQQLAAQAGSGDWPELSALRCTDCHHSLAEQRWLHQAGARRPLGLPRWSPARWAVLRHLVDAFAPAARDGLDRRVATLSSDLSRFAPAARVAATADAAASELAPVVERLAEVRWDDGQVSAMLLRIAADRRSVAGGDRETAEQVFLALNTLTSELLARRSDLATDGMISSLEAMARSLEDPNAYDHRRFADLLGRFEAQARSALR